MAEVTNELIYKLMLELQAEQKAMRGEQKELGLKVGDCRCYGVGQQTAR